METEEKAKRYDELLLKLQKAKVDDNVCDEMYYRVIDNIVPELKESEDEKIRKWLISQLKIKSDGTNSDLNIMIDKSIDWLEKQGKQNQYHNFPKFDFDDILALQCCMETAEKVTEDKELYEKLKSLHSRLHDAYWLEKQGEQKPQGKTALEVINEEHVNNANKVEPFDKYEGLTDFERTLADICFAWISEEESGWKQYIKDNADVLLKIAAKKFNSVQDAAFDHKPAWSYEDEANLNNIIWLCNNCIKGSETTWIPSQATKIKHLIETIKEKGLVQQNPAWSEEDKNLLEISVANLTELKDWFGKDYCKVGDCISWLKSLKQRYTWKPSDEQLDALQYVYRNTYPPLSDKLGWNSLRTLELMCQDLKKLK